MAPQFDTLGSVFDALTRGRFPVGDGDLSVVPVDEVTGFAGVYSFTGHAVMSTTLSYDELVALGADGYGMSNAPEVVTAMAGPAGSVGVLDNLTMRRGIGGRATGLRETDAFDDHRRVRYARMTRRDVRVFAHDLGLITLGRGIAGRLELGLETLGDEAERGRRAGAVLLDEALRLVGDTQVVWASCAPGNARSLRALLGAGFELVGSEVLISRHGPVF
ncbi:MAG: hypothetical protein GX868_11735 [Actinobacteria bacterium]|nr:hypothetical protein [Actinomycetota bacterium]